MCNGTTAAGLRGTLAAVAAGAFLGCGPSPITAARIEGAIAPTFANLVHLQLSRMGLPPIVASEITVTATCRKLVAGSGVAGAGDWTCTLMWYGPNRRFLRDAYDLSVGTDGCYSATIEGGEMGVGSPIVVTSDGRSVRNVLYTFEGCFDTT